MENRSVNKNQIKSIIGLSWGHFNIDLYSALLIPLYPLFVQKMGINLAIISFIIAFGHLVSSMMQPVFGFVADKLRHRFFMVWGLVLTSIFIPLTIKSNTILTFTLCLLLGMLGNAFFHPQVSALVRDFNKNNPYLVRFMGIFLGLGTIGYAIGPYLATFTIENFGENAFLFLGSLGILSCIFMYLVVPKMPEKDCYIKENFFQIMKEIIKNKACMFLMFISIIKSAVSVSFGTYIPFLLSQQGFSLEKTGLIVTLFFIAGGIATITSSKVERLIGANGVVVLSFLSILPLCLLFLCTLKYSKILACFIFILIGFFILLSVSVILVHAQNQMPKYTGVVSGVMQGFSWGFGALFLAPLGIIGQIYGVDKILILMSAIAFVVGFYTLKKKCLN